MAPERVVKGELARWLLVSGRPQLCVGATHADDAVTVQIFLPLVEWTASHCHANRHAGGESNKRVVKQSRFGRGLETRAGAEAGDEWSVLQRVSTGPRLRERQQSLSWGLGCAMVMERAGVGWRCARTTQECDVGCSERT